MPWVIGVDEAGYGPNLGPLVQAAVAMRLPEEDLTGWDALKTIVRRACDDKDHRLLVDDSKLVYQGVHGMSKLERGVFDGLGRHFPCLHDFASGYLLDPYLGDLCSERWFEPKFTLPLHSISLSKPQLPANVSLVNLVQAERFNRIVDETDSKAAVLARGLIGLLQAVTKGLPEDSEPLYVVCDKHGGRHFYTSLVQSAFPEGWVTAERQDAEESRYRIEGLNRSVLVVFRPRADSGSVSVALASMLCKYLREVCMLLFNRFWATHVPDLKPTAGYPGDAKRYYESIRGAMTTLGLHEDHVWRKR
jgi:ribonuclease HII